METDYNLNTNHHTRKNTRLLPTRLIWSNEPKSSNNKITKLYTSFRTLKNLRDTNTKIHTENQSFIKKIQKKCQNQNIIFVIFLCFYSHNN